MPNLILIGLRGSGKSTIGRAVAVRLARPFVDLDDLTPRELGCTSVAEAWSRGEGAFRAAEVGALRNVIETDNQVIALGGGTPTAPGAADLLREHRDGGRAVIIYLRATPEILRERLADADNAHRPALLPGSSDPLSEIDRVHTARDPVYRALASAVIETGTLPEADVIAEIARLGTHAHG